MTPQPDSPEDIIHDFLASLQGYESMNDLYHDDEEDTAHWWIHKILDNTPDFIAKLDTWYTNKFLGLLKDEHADICNLNFSYAQSAGCNCAYKDENQLRDELRQAIKQLSKEQINNADQ